MQKTVITHFYNEEYLLPWWLNHHKKYFDHGIMIDYNSTDRSVEIIKEICPTWEIHTTKNQYFYPPDIEPEILEYEKNIQGWRVVLNTTEFLFGNFDMLKNINEEKLILLGSHVMVDSLEKEYTEVKDSLFKDRCHGIHKDNGHIRYWRAMSNYLIDYPTITGPGRHWGAEWTERTMGISTEYAIKNQSNDFFILWYGYSPWNENLIKRKMQIQTKNHPNGTWAGDHDKNRDQFVSIFKQYQSMIENLSYIIEPHINA